MVVFSKEVSGRERSSIQKADNVFAIVDLQTRYDGSLLTFVPSFGRKYDTEDQRRRMQMANADGVSLRWGRSNPGGRNSS